MGMTADEIIRAKQAGMLRPPSNLDQVMAFMGGIQSGQDQRRARTAADLDNMKREADLRSSGFEVQPRGGGVISNIIRSMSGAPRQQLGNYQDPVAGRLQAISGPQGGLGQAGGMRPSSVTFSDGKPSVTFKAPDRLENEYADKAAMTIENNVGQIEEIEKVMENLDEIPTGLMGSIKTNYSKLFNPNDPMLGIWQNLKSILMDAQLSKTALTKGAISDKEMAMFADAVANSDILSLERIKPVIAKLKKGYMAELYGANNAYKRIRGEYYTPQSIGSRQENEDPLGLLS